MQNFRMDAGLQLPLRFNICPTQEIPVIRQDNHVRKVSTMRWGLVPSWADDLKISTRMINARSETVAEKPAFRSALRNRRCLIPADGFYEWKTEGKKKTPYWFRRSDDQPFAFAGLWDRWSKHGAPIESCTILTTSANEVVAPLHNRMPVILSPSDYDIWLDPDATDPSRLSYLFEPFPANEMVATPLDMPLAPDDPPPQ